MNCDSKQKRPWRGGRDKSLEYYSKHVGGGGMCMKKAICRDFTMKTLGERTTFWLARRRVFSLGGGSNLCNFLSFRHHVEPKFSRLNENGPVDTLFGLCTSRSGLICSFRILVVVFSGLFWSKEKLHSESEKRISA
jgi:hypothetical protein